MDLSVDESIAEFRQEVRRFIVENLPADLAARGLRAYHEEKSDVIAWMKILAKQGWSATHWPLAHGGTGWSSAQQLVFEEECMRAGAPQKPIVGLSLVAPIIYTFGSEEQKQAHLPGIRNAETWWGQCFSEPNAGSDLASLKTSAEFNGSHYIINGHKIWTTLGQFADWLFLLAVTDKTVKPQQGISFFLIKADSPGITMRPIYSIEKGHTLNEFFFDDVAVPVSGLLGEEGKGWSYAKFLLENERAWSAEIPRNKALLNRLKRIASESIDGEPPLIERPSFREKICDISARLNALEYMTLRAMSEQHEDAGESLSAWEAGSVLHIKGSEMQQEIGGLMMDALGPYGAEYFPRYLAAPDDDYPAGPEIAHGVAADYLYRRATTIYGGSNEIQRNIIAAAMLGKF
jgi:alkylation response protein AidB-like acyl-CoA dehydrogenase